MPRALRSCIPLVALGVCFLLSAAMSKPLAALTTCGPVTVNAPSGGPSQAAIESAVCDNVNSKFQTAGMPQVLSYMAQAYAMASVGTVADYGSNMHVFSLGVATTAGVSGIGVPTSASDVNALTNRVSAVTVPDFGVGAGFNATFGISLRHINFRRWGWFDLKRLNIYVAGSVLPTLSFADYSLSAASGSLYLQYKILPFKKIPWGLLTWGGLDVGVGYTYTTMSATVASTSQLTSINFTTNGQNVSYSPTGSVGLTLRAHTMPFELSTNFSLFYFLTLVAGAAADFHLYSAATMNAAVSGAVAVGGTSTASDYANFSINNTASITNVGFRAFFGPQFNIWKIRVYALVHLSTNQNFATTVGARFTW